jgi:DNA replication and repair protein RecF
MQLKRLSLTNFRNFARLDIDFPPGAIVLVGANAQGKTSVLEAVYFLATLTSFHAEHDRQLINFIAGREAQAVARIVAEFTRKDSPRRGGVHKLEVRIIQDANGGNGNRVRKEMLLDNSPCKAGQVIGRFNAALFEPQTLRVIEGAPDDRRRYLNLTLAQVVADHAAYLSEYQRALGQRNALLKQLAERGGDAGQLDYWDEQLARLGARLIYDRIQAIAELETWAADYHARLTRGGEVLRLAYQPSFDPMPRPKGQFALALDAPVDRRGAPVEKIEAGLRHSLGRLRSDEIARGVTTTGPHRDDLRFLGNGIDLGVYGSRGQARTAILALKLAEVAWMHSKTGEWPVLLLDEVLAELDAQRRADLLEHAAASEQALLTTTDLDSFSEAFLRRSRLWRVNAGRLEAWQSEPAP